MSRLMEITGEWAKKCEDKKPAETSEASSGLNQLDSLDLVKSASKFQFTDFLRLLYIYKFPKHFSNLSLEITESARLHFQKFQSRCVRYPGAISLIR